MPESLKFMVDLPVSTERAYRAWLDSYEHSRFTGEKARIDGKPGSRYTSLGDKVHGQIRVATPFSHIVQTLCFKDFPPGVPDSLVDIKFEPTCTGCQMTISQTGIPDTFSKRMLDVWENRYLRPMKNYFDALVGEYVEDMDG